MIESTYNTTDEYDYLGLGAHYEIRDDKVEITSRSGLNNNAAVVLTADELRAIKDGEVNFSDGHAHHEDIRHRLFSRNHHAVTIIDDDIDTLIDEMESVDPEEEPAVYVANAIGEEYCEVSLRTSVHVDMRRYSMDVDMVDEPFDAIEDVRDAGWSVSSMWSNYPKEYPNERTGVYFSFM